MKFLTEAVQLKFLQTICQATATHCQVCHVMEVACPDRDDCSSKAVGQLVNKHRPGNIVVEGFRLMKALALRSGCGGG